MTCANLEMTTNGMNESRQELKRLDVFRHIGTRQKKLFHVLEQVTLASSHRHSDRHIKQQCMLKDTILSRTTGIERDGA